MLAAGALVPPAAFPAVGTPSWAEPCGAGGELGSRVGPASANQLRPTSATQALDQARDSTLRALRSEPLHLAIAGAVFAQSYLDVEQAQHARDTVQATLAALGPDRADLRPERLRLDLKALRQQKVVAFVQTGDLCLDGAAHQESDRNGNGTA